MMKRVVRWPLKVVFRRDASGSIVAAYALRYPLVLPEQFAQEAERENRQDDAAGDFENEHGAYTLIEYGQD